MQARGKIDDPSAGDMDAFFCQDSRLLLRAMRESPESAVAGHYTVAWHDRRVRVAVQGLPYCPIGAAAERVRDLFIGGHFPSRYPLGRLPDALVKGSHEGAEQEDVIMLFVRRFPVLHMREEDGKSSIRM